MYQSILNQYFVCPPLASITACNLDFIVWTYLSHKAGVIAFHSSSMMTFKVLIFLGFLPLTIFFSSPQICSIGLRSGLMAGHSITLIFLVARNCLTRLDVCLGSLSCWKTHFRPTTFLADGSIFFSRISFPIHDSINKVDSAHA